MLKRVVWKYPMTEQDKTFQMPVGAKFRHADIQHGELCLWMEVNPDNPLDDRRFAAIGTGHEFDPGGKEFCATVLLASTVWHVYEVRE